MSGRIYIIECVGHGVVKVGIARDTKKRLRELQGACPFELKIRFQTHPLKREVAAQVEHRAHTLLDEFHVRGEWFSTHWKDVEEAIRNARRYVKNRRANTRFKPALQSASFLGGKR